MSACEVCAARDAALDALAAELAQLRQELAAVKVQRDDARRLVMRLQGPPSEFGNGWVAGVDK